MGNRAYMTKAGYALQAKLFAEGGEFHVTRVEVGRGAYPGGTDFSAVTGLADAMARATSTVPIRKGCEVSLEVEYRSDLNGGLEELFQITEFGLFATGAEGREELILYGDLSDYPEAAVPLKHGGCVRRWPVSVTVGPDAGASLGYPAGAWVTHGELGDAVDARVALHNGDKAAHPHLLAENASLAARVTLMELVYNTQVRGNPFTVTFENLEGLEVEGVWNVAQGRVEF